MALYTMCVELYVGVRPTSCWNALQNLNNSYQRMNDKDISDDQDNCNKDNGKNDKFSTYEL